MKSLTSTLEKSKGRRSWKIGPTVAEPLECRRLLSAGYVMTTLANQFGVNDTGANPYSTLVADSTGNLYGTTSDGGAYGKGTVFEIVTGSGAITTLASFHGDNGANPSAGLTLDAAGNLYGTTFQGGSYDWGTVFEVVAGSDAITTLASFNYSDGADSEAGVALDAAGNLYGTTSIGGSGAGTVFEIASGSGAITTLASLPGRNNPAAGVTLDAAGNLYGTTDVGGNYNLGSVFELPKASGTIETLASFNGSNGGYVVAGLTLDSAGNLYGTTAGGGSTGDGTVFEIASGSDVVTTLATFNGDDGVQPTAALTLDSAGNLYGTTTYGGASNDGTAFEIPAGSSAIATLVSFNGTNGANPDAGLTFDAAGNLYGTTSGGGGVGMYGTVFKIAAGNGAFTTVAPFNPTNGFDPYGALTFDSAGNLYGTTGSGGTYDWGTVFEIAAGSGTITTLASFSDIDGQPSGGLTLDSAGNLYGATTEGDGATQGTVFEIDAGSSVITTLASFTGDNGANPNAGLTLDSAGNLFGTTQNGGSDGEGTVFEIAHGSGVITTLASFNGANGANPAGGLAMDSAGNLYGTTQKGGSDGDGTVFEIANGSGAITTLASFNGADGSNPTNGLTLDSAGNLYGTTQTGGPPFPTDENGFVGAGGGPPSGTVFEVAAGSGVITTLATFYGPNGAGPFTGLTLDPAGNLYGTTEVGGTYGDGTVFEIDGVTRMLTTLVSFNYDDGADPLGGLAADSEGDLFGTTAAGGSSGGSSNGTVFELRSTLPVADVTGPDMAVQYQTLSLTFSATDVLPATDAAGYQYQIDWGDGSGLQTVAATPGNGGGVNLGHVFTAPGSYNVSVTVIDSDGLSSRPVIHPVQITEALTLAGGSSASIQSTLQDIANNVQQASAGGSSPAIQLQISDQATLDNLLSAISGLQVSSSAPAVDITVNASNATYQDTQVSVPPNVTLTLNGATFVGGSPALVVTSGTVIVTNSTLTNSTNAPTILVKAGNLVLRGDIIRQSSTTYAQPAIEVDGGTVDLGSASDPGTNTLDVDGGAVLIDNASSNSNAVPIDPAAANIFEISGTAIGNNSALEGEVWADFNNDGNVDFGEQGINGVTITLSGTNTLGQQVQLLGLPQVTGSDGIYTFTNLWPGLYTITEQSGSALSAYLPGIDSQGTLGAGGVSRGVFSNVPLGPAQSGFYYNFGQQPAPGSNVTRGQAAGIGFWANPNGQKLLLQMASDTPLGPWLAATLPQVFGSLTQAKPADLLGLYKDDFLLKDKLAAQYMATALNVYSTNPSLGGSYAQEYGFSVGQYGLGDSTWNVGTDGQAFGVANDTTLTVIELLQDGQAAINGTDSTTRKMALDVFGGINSKGGI